MKDYLPWSSRSHSTNYLIRQSVHITLDVCQGCGRQASGHKSTIIKGIEGWNASCAGKVMTANQPELQTPKIIIGCLVTGNFIM